MTFFSRFHKIIAVTYGFLFLCAALLFGFLYNEHKASRLSVLRLRLLEQTQALDFLLRVRSDAVQGMRIQAEDFLKSATFCKSLYGTITLQDSLSGTYFHLDEPSSEVEQIGNITGLGSITRLSDENWKEITMAYSLNPLFKVLRSNIGSLRTAEYISKHRFRNRYPWQPSKESRFHENIFNQQVYKRALPENNPEKKLFWTDVYVSFSDDELMIMCAAPVYKEREFRGVVSMGFSLEAIDTFIESIYYQYGRLLVLNDKMTVLADTDRSDEDEDRIIRAEEALPQNIDLDQVMQLEKLKLTNIGDYWVFIAQPEYAPWTVLFYISTWELEFSIWRHIGPSFLLILIFGAIVMIGTHRIIAREFIMPAQRLVKHIASQAKGGSRSYKDVQEPWNSWFEAVSKVFKENRKLVGQLEKHIHDLDHTVLERTKALSTKNQELEEALTDLKKAQNQIIVQEKLAGLGALAAGIAHEIKNPLNFIINFSSISKGFAKELSTLLKKIKDKKPSPENLTEIEELTKTLTQNMEKIEDHGQRADAIVRGMLMHAKGGMDTLQDTDLHKLLDENALLALTGFRRKGFEAALEKHYDKKVKKIKTYQQDLGRVLLNMIHNAYDAMSQKKENLGKDYSPKLTLSTEDRKKEVILRIRDNGPGIPKKIQKNIFNPFFTTKPTGEGTGLGLSLCYDIITQQHHGKIDINSVEGEFTEFILRLPKEIS